MTKEVSVSRNIRLRAKEQALENGQLFHLSAILRRGKSVVYIGNNSDKTHPKFKRKYADGHCGYAMHAEMDALRFARPGDTLEVLRWTANGTPSMSKPCKYCMKHIKEAQISKVIYTDWDGNVHNLRIKNERSS